MGDEAQQLQDLSANRFRVYDNIIWVEGDYNPPDLDILLHSQCDPRRGCKVAASSRCEQTTSALGFLGTGAVAQVNDVYTYTDVIARSFRYGRSSLPFPSSKEIRKREQRR